MASFARDLRMLRSKADLDYPEMAEKSHYTMRTLASAAGGMKMPTLPVLIAYVAACDGDQAEWEERWGKIMKADGAQPTLPAPDAGDAVPSAPAASDSGSGSSPGSETTADDQVYVITSAPSRDTRW